MKHEFIAQPAGIMSPAFARISFCAYLLKFTGTDLKKKHIFWCIIITQAVVNGLTLLEVLISCEHFASLWDPNIKGRCWSPKIQAYMGFFQGAWNSLTDLLLTFLPFLLLKNLNMKLSTRAALSVIMGMSIFAMAACIVKTVELQYIGERMDFTYDTSRFVIWFTLEQYIVIVAASIPTIRPLALHLAKKRREWTLQSTNNSARDLRPQSVPARDTTHSWRPRAVRLHSMRTGEKMEVEAPYLHPPPTSTPHLGTIRTTISIYIRSESRSTYERGGHPEGCERSATAGFGRNGLADENTTKSTSTCKDGLSTDEHV